MSKLDDLKRLKTLSDEFFSAVDAETGVNIRLTMEMAKVVLFCDAAIEKKMKEFDEQAEQIGYYEGSEEEKHILHDLQAENWLASVFVKNIKLDVLSSVVPETEKSEEVSALFEKYDASALAKIYAPK